MKPTLLLTSIVCLAAWLPLSGTAAKPNVLVIVADDLGYADIGANGCKDIPTPNIDSIAKNGVRFTNGYVSGPYCSPTRAGLLTGRYQQRFGHEFNPGPAQTVGEDVGLPLTETTFANRFKDLGYTTGCVGKWHLGYAPPFHPQKRGFDEYFGFLGGAHSYIDNEDKRNIVQRNGEPVPSVTYTTDMFGDEASAFIERHKDKPWFLYFAFNAVHTPMHAQEKYLVRFPDIQDPLRQKLAAMHSCLDDNVGKVLAKLREHNLEEDTLIFFVSDNGGPTASNGSRNDPLRGFKAQTWEGGIRVAFLMQWKGQVPAGRVYDHPVIQLDFLPTALAAAGQSFPGGKLDGVNLLPYVKGDRKSPPHPALYWRFGPQIAIRMGDWKLVKAPGGGTEGAERRTKADAENAQLYNLATDIGEKNNLAAIYPDKFKELAAAWTKWDRQLVEPKWLPNRAGSKKKKKVAK